MYEEVSQLFVHSLVMSPDHRNCKGIDLREPFNQFLKHIAQVAQLKCGAQLLS